MPKNQVNKSQNGAASRNGQSTPSELDQFFELSFDMLCIAGTDGYFKRVNSAFERTLGWSADQLLAKPIVEFVHPDDQASTLAVIEKLGQSSDTIMFENRCRCEDGSYKQLSWNTCPTMNNTLYGVVRDITERKEVEESLRENSQRYQILFEDSPISLWEEDFTDVKAYIDELRHDGVTDLSSYFDDHPEALTDCIAKVKILDVNQATIELYEAKDKEDFFSGLHRVFGEGSPDDFKKEIVFLADGHMKYEQEVINYTLTGDRKYLFFKAQIAPDYEETWGKVLISMVDVTERVLVEWALRESSQRYQSLFEDSPISLWEEDLSAVKRYLDDLGDLGVIDLEAHFKDNPDKLLDCIESVKITDVNQATLELYGAKDKESFFHGLNTVFGDESITAFKNEIVALAEGQTRFEQEVVNYTLNKERKDLVLRAFVAPGYEDDWSKVLITIIDITDRKELERQIQGSLERRERQVETSTEIAQEIATAPVLEALFRQVVELVQTRFGYYHAHVYTIEGDDLIMQEGTGEAGREMKEKGHKIALAAKKSLVARSARKGEPVLVSNVSKEPGWLPNRLLPETQSELAVPIMLRDEVLGVLDVQSNTIGGLDEEDELMLMGLCGQIAIAIEHRRAETERQQAEEALRQSEARLAEALTIAQLGHWELDIATQMFTFNDQFYALLATNAEQEGGYLMPAAQYAETFMPPEEMYLVVEETKKAIETTDPNYHSEIEHRIIRADGTEGYFLVRIRVIKDEQGQTIKTYGANQDITERKQAELEQERLLAEVQESERLTRTIIDSTPDWIFIKDQHHLYRMVNRGYANSFHMEPEEFIGQNDLDIGFPAEIVKGDPERGIRGFWADDRQVMDSGETKFVPSEPAVVDGEARTLSTIKVPLRDDNGAVWGVLGYVRDITESIRVQAQLETKEAQLSEALDIAQMAYWELDIESLKLILNDTFYAILGTTAEAEGGYALAVEEYTRRFVHPDEADVFETGIEQAIAATDPTYSHQLEYRLVRTTGEERYVFVKFRIAQNEQGHPLKVYGMLQDITERKRAEAQVAERVKLATFEAEIGLALTQSSDLREMLQHCVETVVEHLEVAFARIWLFDPIENMLELQASAGMYTHLDGGHARVPVGKFKIGLIAQEHQAHLTNDVLNDPRVSDKAWAKKEGMVAFAGYPLLIEDKLVGVIAMFARYPLQELVIQALGLISNTIALAIENRQTEAVLAKRATELETVTQLSTQVASMLEPEQLLQSVVDLTKEGFDLYHAHIYLLNETGNMLNLVAGAGQVGRQMVADRWRIPLEREDSMVAQTARTRQGMIVNDVHQARNYLPNPLLPDTRSEIAVPLIAGDQLLGVLDVQADRLNRFTAEDLRIQTTLAAQVAVAWQNARSFGRSEEALAELDLVTRRLTRQGWKSYLNAQANTTLGFAYDLYELETIQDAPLLVDPVDPVITHSLVVQGESIGQLALVEPQLMADTATEIIDAVIERLSIHLENLRLSEQTQAALIEQERLTRELETVAKVSATTSSILDAAELLQTVVDLTKESFNLYHAHIYLFNEAENTLDLTAGADEVGRKLVDQGWRIPLYGEQSLVALAGRDREGVIANNVQEIPDFLPNPLLPDTKSEMAVPMIIGDRLAGVLDVQADEVDHFSEDDIRIKTALAAQIAVAHQNAVLYDKQASTIERLRELEQLKSSFLASMSHELRTPLNSIIGFAELILAGIHGSLADTLENDMKVIQKNGQHLLSLINDVLDMAKIEAGRMNLQIEEFNLYEVLEEAVDITAPLAREKSLALNLTPDGTEPLSLEADRFRMRQIMINLISNAIKFTETGRVTIETEQVDDWVRIGVHDTGIGVPSDQTEIIFEAFRQVDSSTTRKAGGTGLGLLICRHLVELHGGRLWVESSGIPGEGSSFYIELPSESPYEPIEDAR